MSAPFAKLASGPSPGTMEEPVGLRQKRGGMSSKETLAHGRHLHLVRLEGWEFVERPGVTAIVAILAETEGHLVLIEQYRPPVRSRVIELPAGLVGDVPGAADEPLEAAAQRELEEETGYRAERFTLLAAGPATAGASSEIISFLRAHGIHRVSEGGGDETEDIQVHLVPADSVDEWLAARREAGVLVDTKVYTGLYFWLRDRVRLAPTQGAP